jgi:hypothetical protein
MAGDDATPGDCALAAGTDSDVLVHAAAINPAATAAISPKK